MITIHGEFRVWAPRFGKLAGWLGEPDFVLPNLITDQGKEEYLKMIFQNVSAIIGGANWYVGMCDQVPLAATLLADIVTEPAAAGGYARQAITRDNAGWPTLAEINNFRTITSTTESFVATGADFSVAFSRLFLTDQATGTIGKLYAVSGARTTAVLVLSGQTIPVQYRIYF